MNRCIFVENNEDEISKHQNYSCDDKLFGV